MLFQSLVGLQQQIKNLQTQIELVNTQIQSEKTIYLESKKTLEQNLKQQLQLESPAPIPLLQFQLQPDIDLSIEEIQDILQRANDQSTSSI